MKIMRIGPRHDEVPAMQRADGVVTRLAISQLGAEEISSWLDGAVPTTDDVLSVDGRRLGAPWTPGKVVCVGLNYRAHAREAGQAEPDEPILFLKTPDVVVGPVDPVRIPAGSTRTDYEVELGVVIGRTAKRLADPSVALEHVWGYVLANDVSEREYQLDRGGSWDKGKNCDDFLPLGPWIATADEIPDPQDIHLETWVNGELRQSSSTADMIFPVDHLVWYISQFMTLRPGDLVLTGTPHGVGAGLRPPRFLEPGDLVEIRGTGLGGQQTRFVAEGTS